MADESRIESSKKTISLKNLFLDPNNFRLINEADYVAVNESQIKDKDVVSRTYRLLVGEKNQNIQDLIGSFKGNDFLPVDQIQVKSLQDGTYVVVEGNRRVATLKYLQKEYDEKKIDLGKLNPDIFSKVPIVFYENADEVHHLTLMALKHISGNKKWEEWNQARLLEKLKADHGLSEDEICARTQVSRTEFRRTIRALSLCNMYKDSDYGDQFSAAKFPIFRELARNASLKKWIGFNDYTYEVEHRNNLDLLFSLISRVPEDEEDEDGQIPFNNKHKEPAIGKRDELRTLEKVVQDPKALRKLEESRDINAAYRASDLIFKEREDDAIKSVVESVHTLNQLKVTHNSIAELEKAYGKLRSIIEQSTALGALGVEQRTVFYDKIDTHLSSLQVNEYKRLQNLGLHGFSKINLLAGENNAGKTSVLEAIYLLIKQNDFGGLQEIIRRRGKVNEGNLNMKWLVDQIPEKISINGNFDKQQADVTISHFTDESTELDRSRYIKTILISSSYKDNKQESTTHLFKGRDISMQAGSIKLLCLSVFSTPFFLNEPYRYTSFYHKSVQSKSLPTIFEFIRNKVISTISDVRLVDDLQRFLVSDEAIEFPLDLTQYGEGLQRIFFISLLFASAQNGIVLIDEFENAIHTSLIPDFTRFICSLANHFNVQLFVTSHSKECIDSFVQNIDQIDDLYVAALVEDEQKIIAREYTGRKFKQLLDSANVDIRRAL